MSLLNSLPVEARCLSAIGDAGWAKQQRAGILGALTFAQVEAR